jgi:UDP-N-acetyl-2-amino-2-deoxyglucuronate dehydrogenase
MTTSSIAVAVIGCGRIARHHCRSIAATKDVRIAAVCDLVPERAKDIADEFGIEHFANYRRMFEARPEINTVVIATPSGMHFEHAMEVLERYRKNVIVEKPTFLRLDHFSSAYATAARLGLHVFPVFQNRYNKAVARVRTALANDELGAIRLITVRVRWCRPQRYYDLAPWRGTFSHDGGALTNQGVHHVDLLRHLGGEVEAVHSVMRTMGANIEVEDTAVAVLKLASGATGTLEVTTAARPDDFEASVSIVGSKGMAQLGGIAVNELQVFTPDPAACAAHSENFVGINGHGAVYGFGHYAMYQDIAAFFRSGTPYPVPAADARATLQLLHAFYRSDEIDGWVRPDGSSPSDRLGRPNDEISRLYRTPLDPTSA